MGEDINSPSKLARFEALWNNRRPSNQRAHRLKLLEVDSDKLEKVLVRDGRRIVEVESERGPAALRS